MVFLEDKLRALESELQMFGSIFHTGISGLMEHLQMKSPVGVEQSEAVSIVAVPRKMTMIPDLDMHPRAGISQSPKDKPKRFSNLNLHLTRWRQENVFQISQTGSLPLSGVVWKKRNHD